MMIDGNPRMDVCITIKKWIHDHPLIYIYVYIHIWVYNIQLNFFDGTYEIRQIYNAHLLVYVTYVYIYIQKFLGMQCFCYIIFDNLCSYTCDGSARDPHRLSDFLRGCQRLPKNVQRVMKIPKEKEGGKTNIVCVCLRVEVAKEREPFCF